MFRKKITRTRDTTMKIDFSPEEIVKILSDISVTIPVTSEEFDQVTDLISSYGSNPPKILVKVVSETGAQVHLVNFQMFYANQNQIAPGEPECK